MTQNTLSSNVVVFVVFCLKRKAPGRLFSGSAPGAHRERPGALRERPGSAPGTNDANTKTNENQRVAPERSGSARDRSGTGFGKKHNTHIAVLVEA